MDLKINFSDIFLLFELNIKLRFNIPFPFKLIKSLMSKILYFHDFFLIKLKLPRKMQRGLLVKLATTIIDLLLTTK